jgi:hypothetical protein
MEFLLANALTCSIDCYNSLLGADLFT